MIHWLIIKRLIGGIRSLCAAKKVHILYISACAFNCTTGYLFCLILSLICPLSSLSLCFVTSFILTSSSALTLLLCFSFPNFFHYYFSKSPPYIFCSPSIFCLKALSLSYIKKYLFLRFFFVCSLFLTPSV